MTRREQLEAHLKIQKDIISCAKYNMPKDLKKEFHLKRNNSDYFDLKSSPLGDECVMHLKSNGLGHMYYDNIYGVRFYFIHRSSHHEPKDRRSLFCIRGKYYLTPDPEIPSIEDCEKINMTDRDFEYLGDERYLMSKCDDHIYNIEFERKTRSQ